MASAGAHAAQQELDRRKARELAAGYPGWRVWSSNAGARYAVRKGTRLPHPEDTVFARTLDADDWTGLEAKLREQHANDRERGYGPEVTQATILDGLVAKRRTAADSE